MRTKLLQINRIMDDSQKYNFEPKKSVPKEYIMYDSLFLNSKSRDEDGSALHGGEV